MPLGSNQVTVTLSTELLQEIANQAAESGHEGDVSGFIARVLEAIEDGMLWDDVLQAIEEMGP